MDFDLDLTIRFLSPLISGLIMFLFNKYFQNRSRLIAYYGHISEFKIKSNESNHNQSGAIRTHTVVIRNLGRLPAKNVKVGHNVLPNDYNITPAIEYKILPIAENATEICFPTLVPKEQVTISYLYFPPLLCGEINTYVKSEEGLAKVINVIPTPSLPVWQKLILYILLFIGCTTVVYGIFRLLIII